MLRRSGSPVPIGLFRSVRAARFFGVQRGLALRRGGARKVRVQEPMETAEPKVPTSRSVDETDAQLIPGWLQRLAAISWRSIAALALGAVLVAIALKLSTVTFAVIIGAIV